MDYKTQTIPTKVWQYRLELQNLCATHVQSISPNAIVKKKKKKIGHKKEKSKWRINTTYSSQQKKKEITKEKIILTEF